MFEGRMQRKIIKSENISSAKSNKSNEKSDVKISGIKKINTSVRVSCIILFAVENITCFIFDRVTLVKKVLHTIFILKRMLHFIMVKKNCKFIAFLSYL